jgi:peptidoglycan-N-acetylglucosamine deacetylase
MKRVFVITAGLACFITGGLLGYAQPTVRPVSDATRVASLSPGLTEGAAVPKVKIHRPGAPPINGALEPRSVGKVVYLTFDDGPTPGYTNEVLADLRAAGARATFFEVGTHMEGNRSILRQQLADGDQIGTHTWDHPDLAVLGRAQTVVEIEKARMLQIKYTGHDSGLVRFPYFIQGTYGSQVAVKDGLRVAWADVDPSDWNPRISDEQIIATVMADVYAGATVELHDGNGRNPGAPFSHKTPSYLPALLSDLKAAGYSLGTLT